MNLIDTHCHLSHGRLRQNTSALLDEAVAAGVSKIICASADLAEIRASAELANQYASRGVYCLAGVHPHEAANVSSDALKLVEEYLAKPRCVGLGEIGLDYHYDYSPRDAQRRAFAQQLEIARKLALPVVIHTREAFDDTMDILADSNLAGETLLFHSFTGGPSQARAVLDIGASISYSGIATFNSAEEIRQATALTPADRIMVETDSPYLSPEPVRKQRTNTPANVALVAARLAEVRNTAPEQFAQETTDNAMRFFSLS